MSSVTEWNQRFTPIVTGRNVPHLWLQAPNGNAISTRIRPIGVTFIRCSALFLAKSAKERKVRKGNWHGDPFATLAFLCGLCEKQEARGQLLRLVSKLVQASATYFRFGYPWVSLYM